MITMDQELYNLISKCREAVAGCRVQGVLEINKLLNDAIEYSLSLHDIDTYTRLIYIRPFMMCIQEYEDRLKPDQMLCDILNESDNEA